MQYRPGANIACKASGMICESDYDAVLPEFENRIKEALRFRLLLDREDSGGWNHRPVLLDLGCILCTCGVAGASLS